MRIIPVIDLKAGQAVHAVAGRRAEYRPVQSVLCASAGPRELAQAMFESLDVDTVYVADLDAIGGAEPAWHVYGEIASPGLDLWLDAGLRDGARARSLVDLAEVGAPLTGIVAGLESLSGPGQLAELLEVVNPRRLILSLDLKDGQPLAPTGSKGWHGMAPRQIVETAVAMGLLRVLVLDLARVGLNSGTGTGELCTWIGEQYPQLELTAGGGVRHQEDLQWLAAAGCDAVLVASALHDGRLTAMDLKAARVW